MNTFSQYITTWASGLDAMVSNGLRSGQYAFNLLNEHRPDLANKIRGGYLDPFHNDDVLPRFFTFVVENWDGE